MAGTAKPRVHSMLHADGKTVVKRFECMGLYLQEINREITFSMQQFLNLFLNVFIAIYQIFAVVKVVKNWSK